MSTLVTLEGDELAGVHQDVYSQTSSATPPFDSSPSAILRLPRELRDQIYGYLLHYNYTETTPYSERPTTERGNGCRSVSYAHTYRFYPEILGVNRQICDEALQMLTSNQFVVIKTSWARLHQAKHVHHVPIVSESPEAIKKFRHHYLSVFIHKAENTKLKNKLTWCLLLRRDLESFCKFMQWIYVNTFVDVPILAKSESQDQTKKAFHPVAVVDGYLPSFKKVKVIMNFRSPVAQPLPERLENRLLQPFQSMVLGGQVVIINGCLAIRRAKSYCAFMGPAVCSMDAMAWFAFEIVSERKRNIAGYFVRGDFQRAAAEFLLLMYSLSTCHVLHLKHSEISRSAEAPIALLLCVILETALTHSFLAWYSGNFGLAFNPLNIAFGLHDSPRIWSFGTCLSQRKTLAESSAVLSWLEVLLQFTSRYPAQTFQLHLSTLNTVLERLRGTHYENLVQNDLGLMQEYASGGSERVHYDQGTPTPASLVKATSIGQHGPLLVESAIVHDCVKPETMQGCFNTIDYDALVGEHPGLGLMSVEAMKEMLNDLGKL